MRDIRFRAWDNKRKEMFTVHELHTQRISGEIHWVRGYGSNSGKYGLDVYGGGMSRYANEPRYELMQLTGLRDKNGKEGFETDCLDTKIGKAIIRFGEYTQPCGGERHIGFYLHFENALMNDTCRKDLGYWLPQSIIIGNIHENQPAESQD